MVRKIASNLVHSTICLNPSTKHSKTVSLIFFFWGGVRGRVSILKSFSTQSTSKLSHIDFHLKLHYCSSRRGNDVIILFFTHLQTVVIGSYLVAHGFFSVYAMCIDTLFICFCKFSEYVFSPFSGQPKDERRLRPKSIAGL